MTEDKQLHVSVEARTVPAVILAIHNAVVGVASVTPRIVSWAR
jgi:hypothetical protein